MSVLNVKRIEYSVLILGAYVMLGRDLQVTFPLFHMVRFGERILMLPKVSAVRERIGRVPAIRIEECDLQRIASWHSDIPRRNQKASSAC